MKSLGIGVIGLGMGKNMMYINDIPELRSEVRAISDVNQERLEECRSKFGVAVSTDYKEVIHRSDIDIVGVFSPDHLHFEMIKEALECGKHVIVTKPMVVSLEEAKATVDLARKHNRKVLVGQTRRFAKRFLQAKKLFDEGKIGKPLFADAHYIHDMRTVFNRTPWRFEVPKDFLYGGACHPIDHLRWFFGDVEEVHALGGTSSVDLRYPQDKELNFLMNLKFKNGTIGRALCAQGIIHPPSGTRLMDEFLVYGDKGTIVNNRVRYEENGEVFDLTLDAEVKIDFDGKEYSGHSSEVLRYVKEMEECIVNDTRPSVNEIEGAKCIAVSEAAWESIRTGKVVKVFNEF
ncbi:MAG: oxidoreductase [Paenibacillaceae bacterium]|nr:oxidoreductase [Paenibacillaceae bacterium]